MNLGFINDKFSTQCQRAQGRQFLRTGVRPAVGQRVELTILLSPGNGPRGQMPFRLSGEVVNVNAGSVGMMQGSVYGLGTGQEKDTAAYHNGIGAVVGASMGTTTTATTSSNNTFSTWRPSTSPEDCGIGHGSVALSHMVRALIVNQHPNLNPTGKQLTSAWDHMSSEKKEKVANAIVNKLGAFHGQRVVCEGR